MSDANSPAGAEPKTFSLDYVRELREENKGLRLAKQAAERERDGHKEAAVQAADAAKAEIARITQQAEAAGAKARTAADQRVIRAELKASAVKAGIIDPDALQLLDTSDLALNDAGEVEGADALMARFKEAKPHFFAAAPVPSTSSTARTPPPKPASAKKAVDMTSQEFAAAMDRINRGLPPG